MPGSQGSWVMLPHLPGLDHGRMDPAPAHYTIGINGHLGATVLSAFPALAPHHHGAHTVLTGLLDRSALYGVLAEIEALGLDSRPSHHPAERGMHSTVKYCYPLEDARAWRAGESLGPG